MSYFDKDMLHGQRMPEHGANQIRHLAEKAGYTEDEWADLYEAVQKHLGSPDQSVGLREIGEAITEAILQDVKGDLVMTIHNMAPEECPCAQCGHQRADLERIRRLHG